MATLNFGQRMAAARKAKSASGASVKSTPKAAQLLKKKPKKGGV